MKAKYHHLLAIDNGNINLIIIITIKDSASLPCMHAKLRSYYNYNTEINEPFV